MRICILCPKDKVEEVRAKEKSNDILRIPVSSTGQLPATHYFCVIATTEEKANEYLAKAELTTIEISEPKAFLDKWNIQIIK